MIKRFEDIVAWQKARELTKEIYGLTKRDDFSKDFGLKDQIQRAAVSVMSNIAEGYERGAKTEFIQFLYIAKGSCGEVRNQLYAALDQGYITLDQFHNVSSLAVEVSMIIYHFAEYLKGTKKQGIKFKTPPTKSMKEELEQIMKDLNVTRP